MHKLRRAARNEAWYITDEGESNFNPFAKSRHPSTRRKRVSDDNSALSRTQSEGAYLNAAETIRRSQYETSDVRHFQTMPEHPRDGPPSKIDAPIEATRGEPEKTNESKELVDNNQETSTGTTGTTGTTLVPESESSKKANGQAHHRKPWKIFSSEEKERDEESQANGSGSVASSNDRRKFTFWSQVRYSIFNSWINVLLFCAPIGIALGAVNSKAPDTINPIAVFVINFIAIIPLAGTLSYATEEIALRTGETIGGLLNATFGNAVELIVSIIALVQDQIVIVQTSLIGSMLSNLLLVMGMCFFFGGLNREQQHFNVTVAQTASSLLALAIGSLIIPTAFNNWSNQPTPSDNNNVAALNAELSRGTSILLLLVYGCYLFFQLKTHVKMYNEPSKKSPKRKKRSKNKGDTRKSIVQMAGGLGATGAGEEVRENLGGDENREEEKEEPQLSLPAALFTLLWSTVLVAVCAEFMVDAINSVVESTGISTTFIGLILLPIVGNAAEHATAVTVACKDKMDLAIGVAIGSSMQIALLVLPLVVTIGWIAGKSDMTLNFNPFEIIILFVAVLLVNYLIADGKSHWLEGVLLQTLYLIIALAAWFFPNDATNPNQVGS